MTTPATASAVMSGENFHSATKIVSSPQKFAKPGRPMLANVAGDEERGEDGRLLREAAHLLHREGVRAVIDARREQEEQRDRQAVRDHQQHDAAGAEHRAAAATPRNA